MQQVATLLQRKQLVLPELNKHERHIIRLEMLTRKVFCITFEHTEWMVLSMQHL